MEPVEMVSLQTLSWTDAQSNTVQYKVAKFSFDSVNIGDGVTVSLFGDNPIHLDITGDATINAVLDANGSMVILATSLK